MRGVNKSLNILMANTLLELNIKQSPSHTSVQNWALQLGAFELTQKPVKAEDWTFILDHVADYGTAKCLLVLGVRQQRLKKNCRLEHRHVKVLSLTITERPTAEDTKKVLLEIIENTGAPRQIISDHGADIKSAVNAVCKIHKDILYTYDITHKCGIMLKHLLAKDARFLKFTKLKGDTTRAIIYTSLAHLTPPKGKDKSRWFNLDKHVIWGTMILKLKNQLKKKDKELFEASFSWLDDFELDIKRWQSVIEVLQAAKKVIKNYGLHTGTMKAFKKALAQIKQYKVSKDIGQKLIKYIASETAGIKEGELLLGTSDIIESIFGKYKVFSSKTPIKEIGKTILMIPVFTMDLSDYNIKHALQQTSTKDVQKWISTNIGRSLFSRRKELQSMAL